jgi:tellurite resistance protein TehA-like permease
MDSQPVRYGPFLVGGLVLSVWLYFLLFETPLGKVDTARWFLYGVLGLVIAAAMWGTRAANVTVRIVVWTGLGIVLGLLGLAAILKEFIEVTAAFLTATGGAVIVTALPGPRPAAP